MDKAQIAAHFEVEADAVVGWRLVDEGATVRVLINYGIGGIKVYQLPAAAFVEPEPLPVPAVINLEPEETEAEEPAAAPEKPKPRNRSRRRGGRDVGEL